MKKYSNVNIEELVKKGEDLFHQGYNCAQSVAGAFCDIYNVPFEQIALMAASFGGGMGRMRLTCGTVSGMAILAGLETGTADPTNKQGKADNYATMQVLANKFKEENGSVICADLLGLRKNTHESPVPSDRTAAYYAGRPCSELVARACRIYAEYLADIEL